MPKPRISTKQVRKIVRYWSGRRAMDREQNQQRSHSKARARGRLVDSGAVAVAYLQTLGQIGGLIEELFQIDTAKVRSLHDKPMG
jgi:hypothetical protein